MDYEVDFRQDIADTWPKSINDSQSEKDWGWKNKFDLKSMTIEMIEGLKSKLIT